MVLHDDQGALNFVLLTPLWPCTEDMLPHSAHTRHKPHLLGFTSILHELYVKHRFPGDTYSIERLIWGQAFSQKIFTLLAITGFFIKKFLTNCWGMPRYPRTQFIKKKNTKNLLISFSSQWLKEAHPTEDKLKYSRDYIVVGRSGFFWGNWSSHNLWPIWTDYKIPLG